MWKKITNIIIYIFAFIGVFLTVGEISDMIRKEPPLNYNPRHAVSGIDTVYTHDSIYTIKVEILNIEPQPPDEVQDYR